MCKESSDAGGIGYTDDVEVQKRESILQILQIN